MELARKLDVKSKEVSFDLLKVIAGNVTNREVGDVGGCAWQALAAALRRAREERRLGRARLASARRALQGLGSRSVYAGGLGARSDLEAAARNLGADDDGEGEDDEAQQIDEASMRARLVECLATKEGAEREAIIKAKMADEASYFHSYRSFDSALQHWQWYLANLTFESSDWAQGGAVDLEDDLLPSRVPLDFVDVQVLAHAYRTEVEVMRFSNEPWLFTFPEASGRKRLTCRVCYHKGLWSPLLGQKPQESCFLESLVELGNLPQGPLEALNGKVAYIQSYDGELEAYIARVEGATIPVERTQIVKVVWSDRAVSAQPDQDVRGGSRRATTTAEAGELQDIFDENYKGTKPFPPGCAPPLRGIPDGSLEMQMLHELVRAKASARLVELGKELTGRVDHTAVGRARRELQRGCQLPNPTARLPLREAKLRQRGLQAQAQAPQQQQAPQASQAQPQQQPRSMPQHPYVQPQASPAQVRNPYANPQAPAEDAPAASAPGLEAAGTTTRRMPLNDVFTHLEKGSIVYVMALGFQHLEGETYLRVDVGDELRLTRHNEYTYMLASRVDDQSGRQAWVGKDIVTVWEVVQPVTDPRLDGPEYLRLSVGDEVIVKRRLTGNWQGWAHGCYANRDGEGLLNLSFLTPKVLLSRELTA